MALGSAGHEVVWSGDWPSDPGDEEILARAHAENRVLITLDKDFGEMAIVKKTPHSGIVRLVGISARLQGQTAAAILEAHGTELLRGAIITVEVGRTRVRPPEGAGSP